jgi:hypothetical protein
MAEVGAGTAAVGTAADTANPLVKGKPKESPRQSGGFFRGRTPTSPDTFGAELHVSKRG